MKKFFWKHDASIKSIFTVILLVLVMWVVSIQNQLTYVPETTQEPTPLVIDKCGDDCKETITEAVSQSIATISASPRVVNISTTKQVDNQQKVTYIPLSGDFSTRLTNWTDINVSDIYIDLAEYPPQPYIDWEATIKAISGKVQVRLFDVTHSIAVASSEIESIASLYTTVSSGRINFWQGRNLYRVQIKSLDGSEVFFDSGRIKIVGK